MLIYIIFSILLLFNLATILFQIKPLKSILSKWDKLNILPNYSFFAPKPLMNDYRLVYKVLKEDEAAEWLEVPMYNNFSPVRLLWHPFKYYNKGMIDTFQFLLQEFEAVENKKYIRLSLPYLSILMVIAKYLKQQNLENVCVRFAFLQSEGVGEIKIKNVVFASYHQNL
jgi:hypothetical protein